MADILANDPYAKVPPFLSVASERIEAFLNQSNIDFYNLYLQTLDEYKQELNLVTIYPWWHPLNRITRNLRKYVSLPKIRLRSTNLKLQELIAILFRELTFIFTAGEISFLFDAQQKNLSTRQNLSHL